MSLPNKDNDPSLPADLPAELNILMGVHLLYWKTNEVMDDIGGYWPLTKNERSVVLALDGPKRMGVLADLMQVLPSTLTAIADELESKGIVRRERSPNDRRAWRLCLTEAGVAVRHEIITKVADMFAEISGLTQLEIKKMSAQMLKISQNIKAKGLPEGATPCQ